MRNYGISARNPNGNPPVADRCIEEVFPTSGQFVTFQCRNRNGHGPDGKYCTLHARNTETIKPYMREGK